MKQIVLMNEQGELGLGVKINFFEHPGADEDLMGLPGYSVVLRSQDEYDGWLIFTAKDDDAEGPWLYMPREIIESKLEIVGEL